MLWANNSVIVTSSHFSNEDISTSCVLFRCRGRAPVYWICWALSVVFHIAMDQLSWIFRSHTFPFFCFVHKRLYIFTSNERILRWIFLFYSNQNHTIKEYNWNLFFFLIEINPSFVSVFVVDFCEWIPKLELKLESTQRDIYALKWMNVCRSLKWIELYPPV